MPLSFNPKYRNPDQVSYLPQHYLLAVVLTVVATIIRLPFQPLVGDTSPYVIYAVAVLGAAYMGGFGPGFLALVLSSLAGNFFFQKPYFSLELDGAAAWSRLILFMVTGAGICLLGGALHRTITRLKSQAYEYEQVIEDRIYVAGWRNSEQLHHHALEAAFMGVWMLDQTGAFVVITAPIAGLLGYSRNDLWGRPLTNLCFEEERQQLTALLTSRKLQEHGAFDFRFRRANGSPLWCTVVTQSICDQEGQTINWLVMLAETGAHAASLTEKKALS